MEVRKKIVDVVAAVILQPDGRFLLARRPEGKPYAGYWEFPGGKVEAGESLEHALKRELHEELGIEVKHAWPWLVRHFDYEHASVKLKCWGQVLHDHIIFGPASTHKPSQSGSP